MSSLATPLVVVRSPVSQLDNSNSAPVASNVASGSAAAPPPLPTTVLDGIDRTLETQWHALGTVDADIMHKTASGCRKPRTAGLSLKSFGKTTAEVERHIGEARSGGEQKVFVTHMESVLELDNPAPATIFLAPQQIDQVPESLRPIVQRLADLHTAADRKIGDYGDKVRVNINEQEARANAAMTQTVVTRQLQAARAVVESRGEELAQLEQHASNVEDFLKRPVVSGGKPKDWLQLMYQDYTPTDTDIRLSQFLVRDLGTANETRLIQRMEFLLQAADAMQARLVAQKKEKAAQEIAPLINSLHTAMEHFATQAHAVEAGKIASLLDAQAHYQNDAIYWMRYERLGQLAQLLDKVEAEGISLDVAQMHTKDEGWVIQKDAVANCITTPYTTISAQIDADANAEQMNQAGRLRRADIERDITTELAVLNSRKDRLVQALDIYLRVALVIRKAYAEGISALDAISPDEARHLNDVTVLSLREQRTLAITYLNVLTIQAKSQIGGMREAWSDAAQRSSNADLFEQQMTTLKSSLKRLGDFLAVTEKLIGMLPRLANPVGHDNEQESVKKLNEMLARTGETLSVGNKMVGEYTAGVAGNE